MKLAFIVDPLAQLKADKDSSVAMMRAAAGRGHEIWTIQRERLCCRDGVVSAVCLRIEPQAAAANWYTAHETENLPLTAFAALLMRQDPPFDTEYIAATWLLEQAERQGAHVFNRPQAIRDHSEKVSIAEFRQFTPPTLIARQMADVQAFIDAHGDTVLKPLDGMGGAGIFRVRHDDPNRNVIVETLTAHGQRTMMAQRYLPAIVDGDKRILLIAGEPVPWALARIPQAGDMRGNLAAGARGEARPLTPRDREIAVALAPTLWARGILLAGIDVIGDCLTEINVTSPTCFVEITQQTGFDVAGRFVDALEAACAG
jgi:glutathione synthase